MKDFKGVLKNTKFRYLWISQILSQLTIQLMNFLIIVKLFETTGSTIATSFVWIAFALPAILIGPFAATWVDLLDKRLVLTATNLAQALTILFYALFSHRYLFLSYIVVFFYSFFNQFYVPAEAAALPKVVSKKRLTQANSLFFLTQQASIVVGLGLAGLFAELVGFKNAFMFASGFLFLAFLAVSNLPGNTAKDEIAKKFEIGMVKFFAKTAEGYEFIKSNSSVWMPFILLMGLYVVSSIIIITLPAIAVEVVQISPRFSGPLMVFPAGVGALTGTLLAAKFLKTTRKKELIDKCLISLGISVWLVIFVVPELAGYIKPLVGAVAFFVCGASYVGIYIPAQTFLQESTPKHLLGRVFGNFWFLATVITILPILFTATITEVFGVRIMFFIIGLVSIVAYIFSLKKGQSLLERKVEVEQ